jgi:hypothetical protein
VLGVAYNADESLDIRKRWESLKAVKHVLPPDYLEEHGLSNLTRRVVPGAWSDDAL